MAKNTYEFLGKGLVPIYGWTKDVPVEAKAMKQLENIASMPFIYKHIAVMPDVHLGIGSTIGSVIPTKGAVIPSAVGLDIGCGMSAVKTSLKASDLPYNLVRIRGRIEKAVPHGRSISKQGYNPKDDKGLWHDTPTLNKVEYEKLEEELSLILKHQNDKYLDRAAKNAINQLGTLGTGNHFIELCVDENEDVWILLHSGSRGIGNRIGVHFIEKAKNLARKWFLNIPNLDLAYFPQNTPEFDEYMQAVLWAQKFAKANRKIMIENILNILRFDYSDLQVVGDIIDCHHNYVSIENHYKSNVFITRKGAVRARKGDMGIIPGSMGERSFIVRGKGNKESFCSCSHGAGRIMSRAEARRKITLDEHHTATFGVECKKDISVIDESPKAYKNIDDVMSSQKTLVDVVHTLKQILCIKG